MKIRLDTIVLFGRDIAKLKSFYEQMLGMEVVETLANEWVLLRAGEAHLGLHRIGEAYLQQAEASSPTTSNTKLVFDIADEPIEQVRERLLAQGVELQALQTYSGYSYWLCDGQDPEGNVFQLRQRKAV